MSEIVEDGSWVPWQEFTFQSRVLESWFDGRRRILHPNVDYPADMPFVILRARIMRAASVRQGTARVWRQEDQVHILCALWR